MTEEGSKIMMKFLRGLDERAIDITTQPGGDFTSYVRDVKSITRSVFSCVPPIEKVGITFTFGR